MGLCPTVSQCLLERLLPLLASVLSMDGMQDSTPQLLKGPVRRRSFFVLFTYSGVCIARRGPSYRATMLQVCKRAGKRRLSLGLLCVHPLVVPGCKLF